MKPDTKNDGRKYYDIILHLLVYTSKGTAFEHCGCNICKSIARLECKKLPKIDLCKCITLQGLCLQYTFIIWNLEISFRFVGSIRKLLPNRFLVFFGELHIIISLMYSRKYSLASNIMLQI